MRKYYELVELYYLRHHKTENLVYIYIYIHFSVGRGR